MSRLMSRLVSDEKSCGDDDDRALLRSELNNKYINCSAVKKQLKVRYSSKNCVFTRYSIFFILIPSHRSQYEQIIVQ